ncbi:hypothetical protein PVAP13_4KG268305 [Panicum virgatum]|uniref:Uncharacterized protein n=1 Tax=Panicum virgatum TaxID=38727 RepID=A0A8T0TRC0_PANVG|nr:hypothetical protein PVAP13_4KG268305 [Panicum virgatum]
MSAQPVAPSCFLAPADQAPAAPSAQDATPTNSPIKCSTKCFSCNVDELKSVDTTIWTASTTLLLFTVEIFTGHHQYEFGLRETDLDDHLVFDKMKRRYINPITPALSVGVVGTAIYIPADYKVLEKMTIQNSVILEPVHAILVDIGPWPPPLKNKNTLFSVSIDSHFCLVLSFSCGQEVVKHVPPRPPPTQRVLLMLNAQLRPIPRPSFCYHIVALQLEDFLMFNGLPIVITICSNLPTLWHFNYCWASTICQVLIFSWSPCLLLELITLLAWLPY